jgi:membrane protein
MASIAAPPPIPGEPIDPPPKAPPEAIQAMEDAEGSITDAIGLGYRVFARFNYARATFLAAGTTYYTFLALFSLIALAYGITALLDADRMAGYVTDALSEAFPGLIGDEGIDPSQLRAIGQAASLIGLIAMLYAGSGAMVAASASIHTIYGAPSDPRNYVLRRVRLLGVLIVLGTLIAFSLVGGSIIWNFSDRVMDAVGITGTENRWLVRIAGIAATLLADFLVVWIILGRLGGIRPPRRALLVGCVAGAFAIQILRIPMAFILRFSVDKPQYGALAVPIGILLVLYLNALAVYGAAALTAGFAERDIPLEEIHPATDIETAQLDVNDD